MKPLGYYASAVASHPDSDILEKIEQQFGSQLQELTNDDKATVLICLVDAAHDPQQVLIGDNFYSDQNASELWSLAQNLSPANQMMLALAITNQLIYGGR